MSRFHTVRFRRRGDLLKFHHRYPGALAGHFLCQVRQKLGQGLPVDTEELRLTDVASWSTAHASLTDVKDQKEVAFLSRVLADLGQGRLPELADLVAMRIREVRAAKGEQGSWDKAGVLSLQPGPYAAGAPIPDAAFHLWSGGWRPAIP